MYIQPKIFVEQVPIHPDYDLTHAPKSSNYYRGHDPSQKSGTKSLEELLGTGSKAPIMKKKSDPSVLEMSLDQMVNFYGQGLDRKASLPKQVEEIKQMEDDNSEVFVFEPVKQPEPVMQVVPVVAPVVRVAPPAPTVDEAATKAQAMARMFDRVRVEKEERRNNMPLEHYDGEMYLVTGMRPVKPVHTSDAN